MGPFERRLIEIKTQARRYATMPHDTPVRGTGRSTGEALMAIGYCLRNPWVDVRVQDHASSQENRMIDRHAMDMVRKLVADLRLEFFKFNLQEMTMRYELPAWEKR